MRDASEAEPVHPVVAAMQRAPRIGEWLSPEERAELDQRVADIEAGRVELVPHEAARAWLESAPADAE